MIQPRRVHIPDSATGIAAGAAASAARAAPGAWLRPLAGHWTQAAARILTVNACVVRVTVVAVRGSGPREAGASMLVDSSGLCGTIGGGHLEWHAIATARAQLGDPQAAPVQLIDLVLGPELGQCCGGRVALWLERLTRGDLPWLQSAARQASAALAAARAPRVLRTSGGRESASHVSHAVLPATSDARVELHCGAAGQLTLVEQLGEHRPPLWIMGAGHVGQSLVRLLAPLAHFGIHWIDSRAELLPADLPEGVTTSSAEAPVTCIGTAPAGTRFVVLTHDHALDFALCRAILERGDAAWVGLIGSQSKAARFRARLLRSGLDPARVSTLTCPIGVPGIVSKQPAAIAIAIAAQLLQQSAAVAARVEAEPPRTLEPSACGVACSACGTSGGGAP